ncbi:MAG: Mercuric resistance operon regulatory protein [Candidatus Celerinatantimonas neptuna]|nr:MAG: Mercuric resistance operon regulatory protein [Candidatus Celerinatantimonas neptuna]
MKISELSKETNVSVRMIRYYEEKKVLFPTRTSSGYRQFTQRDIDLILKIKIFKEIGFTIDDIRPVLQCQFEHSGKIQICDKLKEKLVSKIEQINQKIDNLMQAKLSLTQYISAE